MATNSYPSDIYSPTLKRYLEKYYSSAPKSIGSWVAANAAANNRMYPSRYQLQEIYSSIMSSDNHLIAISRNFKQNVLAQRYIVTDAEGFKLEDDTKLLQSTWFQKLLTYIVEAKLYGYSLIELEAKKGEITSVQSIHRANVSPDRREVLIRPMDFQGIAIDQPQYEDSLVLVDGLEGFGLLNAACPPALMKRFALSSWSSASECWGTPFLSVKTNLSDSEQVEKLKTELLNAGRDRIAIVNDSDELSVVSPAGDVYAIYKEQIDLLNSELSKLILGQTMTTDDGSSRAQADVHENTENVITDATMRFVEAVVNDQIFPKLVNLGLPLEGSRFAFDTSKDSTVQEKLNMITALAPHFKISPETVRELTGIEVEEKSSDVSGY